MIKPKDIYVYTIAAKLLGVPNVDNISWGKLILLFITYQIFLFFKKIFYLIYPIFLLFLILFILSKILGG